jgi:hypothetical protein
MKEKGEGNFNNSVLHRNEVVSEDGHWEIRSRQGNFDEVRKKMENEQEGEKLVRK